MLHWGQRHQARAEETTMDDVNDVVEKADSDLSHDLEVGEVIWLEWKYTLKGNLGWS